MMQLHVLRSLEEFSGLADEWNALLALSASHVPFLRHEYLTTWWQTLGGGEWPQGELFIVTARAEDGSLVGAAPLFLAPNADGEAALMLVGTHEISDYLDFLARPEDLPAFTAALLDLLAGPQAPSWQALDLYNLLESSPTLPILQAAARRCGWSYSEAVLEPSPYVLLPGDWETYLAGIDKKQRHEIRRKLRRMETHPEPVDWYIVSEADRLEAEIEDFMTLMAFDPTKQTFLTQAMRAQMQASMQAAFRAGWLQLAFLTVNGQKAAAYLNFDFDNRIWVYNSGLNPAFRELSPGWVLLGHLLQHAIAAGRDALDFLRGDEDYKYRFGGQNRFVVRATIQKPK